VDLGEVSSSAGPGMSSWSNLRRSSAGERCDDLCVASSEKEVGDDCCRPAPRPRRRPGSRGPKGPRSVSIASTRRTISGQAPPRGESAKRSLLGACAHWLSPLVKVRDPGRFIVGSLGSIVSRSLPRPAYDKKNRAALLRALCVSHPPGRRSRTCGERLYLQDGHAAELARRLGEAGRCSSTLQPHEIYLLGGDPRSAARVGAGRSAPGSRSRAWLARWGRRREAVSPPLPRPSAGRPRLGWCRVSRRSSARCVHAYEAGPPRGGATGRAC